MSHWTDKLRIAQILVESAFSSDAIIAHRYSLTVRTIRAYRKRLDDDPQLSDLFQEKVRTYENNWAAQLAQAQLAGYQALQSMFQSAMVLTRKVEDGELSPEMISGIAELILAIGNALAAAGQVAITKEVIDERLKTARPDHTNGKQIGEMATGYKIGNGDGILP
jgi:hypothetical protein